MISPIGTFLTRMDGALVGGMDSIIAAMTSAMATPVALAAVCYYGVQGLKLANGDPTPLHGFVPQLIRVGIVIWLSSNLDAFNYWVRDVFFTGLPNFLGGVVTGSTGGSINSLSATAAAFDNIWSQLWVIIGTVWTQVGLSVTSVVLALAGLLTAVVGGLGLVVMALVYLCARFVLAVVICMSPVLIGCAMFEATRPIFERAVGKVIALVVLQVAGFIVLQLVLNGHTWFMAQATTAILASVSNAGVFAEALQVLAAMIVWFIAGAYVMWHLPSVAYSIGSGVSISGGGLALALLLRNQGGKGGGGDREARPPSDPPPGSLRLTLPPREISQAGGLLALPPPAPPPLDTSTRS